MVQPGDEIVFPEVGKIEDPETGREVVGEQMVSDRVIEVSPADEGGGLGSLERVGEVGLELERRGRTRLSDIGSRSRGREVTEDDVFIRDSQTDPGSALVGTGADLRQTDIQRQKPSGKFAPPNTRNDPTVPPDRGPNGKFVSPDRDPLDDIGRRDDDGLFDLF